MGLKKSVEASGSKRAKGETFLGSLLLAAVLLLGCAWGSEWANYVRGEARPPDAQVIPATIAPTAEIGTATGSGVERAKPEGGGMSAELSETDVITTPTAIPVVTFELLVLHSNDTRGYTLPCG